MKKKNKTILNSMCSRFRILFISYLRSSFHLRKNIGWPVDNDLLWLLQIFWSWASIIEFNQKLSAIPIVIWQGWEGQSWIPILGKAKGAMKRWEDSVDHSTMLPIYFFIKVPDHLHFRWLSPHPCRIQSWNIAQPILGCYHLQLINQKSADTLTRMINKHDHAC